MQRRSFLLATGVTALLPGHGWAAAAVGQAAPAFTLSDTTGKPVRPTTLVAQVQPPARTTQPVATARTLPQNPRPAQQAALQETRPAAAPAPARPARLTTTQATRMAPPATPVRRSGQAIP